MKIHLATDHAGFEHKESLKYHLLELGHEVTDDGDTILDENDDYPKYISNASEAVAADTTLKAIVFGGSGQGEGMVANRHKGVRCAVYYGGPSDILTYSRLHNDANMLAIGARFMKAAEVHEAVDLWLNTEFSGDTRHVRRLAQF